MLLPLRLELFHQEIDLTGTRLFIELYKNIRRPQISVVFRNFVLQNHVITKGIPGEFANQPVVLVQVVPVMGEDDFGGDLLQSFKKLFDLRASIWEKTIRELLHHDVSFLRTFEKTCG